MKTEILPEKPIVSTIRVGADVGSQHAELRNALKSRSQLVWGEHCTECAYPSCYTTCALYTPRLDRNCRRFEAGFEPLVSDPEFKRVRFRRWGKVEAKGPARAFNAQLTESSALDPAWNQLLGARLTPAPLKRKVAHLRHLSVVDQSSSAQIDDFDAFVLEAVSADGREHMLTVTIKNVDESARVLFQDHIAVTSAYTRRVINIDDISRYVDLNIPHLIQVEPMGDAGGRDIIFGLCDFVKWKAGYLPSVSSEGLSGVERDKPAKVLVWDLDNTLWDGTLVEDGLKRLELIPEAVRAIRALDERGIIQSVASKNDPDAAMQALTHFGLHEYFIYPQISWRPKSEAIRDIASALNLGLDSFVFIDDQAFERAEVVHSHPQVRALDRDLVPRLLDLNCFSAPVTSESRSRRLMYMQEQLRSAAFEGDGLGYREFLRASGLTLTLERLSQASETRAYELSQRTNQLNFMGAKLGQEDVRRISQAAGPSTAITMHCKDKYGEYGLIGLALVDFSCGTVEQFFMSCRVQKKRVEHAFFAWLGSQCRARGVATLQVSHRPTDRNGASRAMLEELGFIASSAEVWSRALGEPFADADLVQIDDRVSTAGADIASPLAESA